MKKQRIKKIVSTILIVFLCTVCLSVFPAKKVYAAGVSVDADCYELYVGDSVTVTVTLYGDEIYAYSGYISCDGIFAGANESFTDGANGEGSVSISYTYRAVSEGEGGIYVSDCMVSDGFERYDCGGGSCYITVLGYDVGGGGTGGNAGGADYNDDYSIDGGYINGKETGEGSGNCKLASLSVEGYDVKDEGHDIYSVSVGGSVEKIKIVAKAEDENATIEGDGEKSLEIGENIFDIIVTAENGLSKTYSLKVTRRGEKIGLTDLIAYLSDKNNEEEVVIVSLNEGDILNAEMLSAISKWGKTIFLNQYDSDGRIVYSWMMDGKKIGEAKDFKNFNPAVLFQTENEEKINKLANYATSKYLNFAHAGALPEGTRFNLAVEHDFKDTDKVQLYYFNPEKDELELVAKNLAVDQGYIKFDLSHCSDYILTRAKLNGTASEEKTNNNLLFVIIIAIALVIIITLGTILLVVLKKKNAKTVEIEKKETETVWQKKE